MSKREGEWRREEGIIRREGKKIREGNQLEDLLMMWIIMRLMWLLKESTDHLLPVVIKAVEAKMAV